jgi:prepilin-type N-terminal cleavage/methylation domain-containing protein
LQVLDLKGGIVVDKVSSLRILNGQKQNKRGFSLIELMIVIGIIAILSVAILPSVTGAKEKATQARYLSDCKTIISAVEVYNALNSSESINDTTTIADLKKKLYDDLINSNDRYLKNWPDKFPSALLGADKKYSDLVSFVNSF